MSVNNPKSLVRASQNYITTTFPYFCDLRKGQCDKDITVFGKDTTETTIPEIVKALREKKLSLVPGTSPYFFICHSTDYENKGWFLVWKNEVEKINEKKIINKTYQSVISLYRGNWNPYGMIRLQQERTKVQQQSQDHTNLQKRIKDALQVPRQNPNTRFDKALDIYNEYRQNAVSPQEIQKIENMFKKFLLSSSTEFILKQLNQLDSRLFSPEFIDDVLYKKVKQLFEISTFFDSNPLQTLPLQLLPKHSSTKKIEKIIQWLVSDNKIGQAQRIGKIKSKFEPYFLYVIGKALIKNGKLEQAKQFIRQKVTQDQNSPLLKQFNKQFTTALRKAQEQQEEKDDWNP
jgi:hypothetical protein